MCKNGKLVTYLIFNLSAKSLQLIAGFFILSVLFYYFMLHLLTDYSKAVNKCEMDKNNYNYDHYGLLCLIN